MTRLLVIGAHSADFVWRSGGAVAVSVSVALSWAQRMLRVWRVLPPR